MSKMRSLFLAAIALVAGIAFTSMKAEAYKVNDNNEIYGYTVLNAIVNEDAYKAGTTTQSDDQKTSAFGFQFKYMRVGFKGNMADKMLGYNINLDAVSGTATLVEGWLTLAPMDMLDINVGQLRYMANYEASIQSGSTLQNFDASYGLDKIDKNLTALASNTRDRGLEIHLKKLGGMADIRITATNGVSQTSEVGGSYTGAKTVFSNGFGDAMYTGMVILKPIEGLRLNAAYGWNKHDKAVVKGAASSTSADLTTGKVTTTSSDAVVDVDRKTYSVGGEFNLADLGLWIDGEYGNLTTDAKDTLMSDIEMKAGYARIGYFVLPKTAELVGRWESFDYTAKDVQKEKLTGYSITANYYIDKATVSLEYSKRDIDGTSDDPASVRARFRLKY